MKFKPRLYFGTGFISTRGTYKTRNDDPSTQPGNKTVDSNQNKQIRSSFRIAAPQILASLGFGFLVGSVAGICIMPTLVIGDLYENPNAEFSLSENEVSWYGSLSYMVQPVASIASGYLQNMFGRRRMMLGATIPLLVSWIILHYAYNVEGLYIAQVIAGLSIGFMEAPSMSYLGESIQTSLRGTLSTLAEFIYIIGTIYLYTLGFWYSWRTISLLGAILPCITFCIIIMLPESPTWYVLNGRIDEAEKALMWLRGWVSKEEVQEELDSIIKAISDNPYSGAKIINREYTPVKNTPSQLGLLKEARIWKPIVLVCIFFVAGNAGSLVGMSPLFFDIFKKLQMPMQPNLILIMSSAMNALGSVGCVMIVHKTGKRFISIGCLTLCTATCFALAAYAYTDVVIPWIPTSLFAINFFFNGLGILTMPWVLVSELFSIEARGLSAGICASSAYISGFFLCNTYLTIEHWMTMEGVFILYGVISLIGAAYLFKLMPETEGKTLREIEEFYQSSIVRCDTKPPRYDVEQDVGVPS